MNSWFEVNCVVMLWGCVMVLTQQTTTQKKQGSCLLYCFFLEESIKPEQRTKKLEFENLNVFSALWMLCNNMSFLTIAIAYALARGLSGYYFYYYFFYYFFYYFLKMFLQVFCAKFEKRNKLNAVCVCF